MKLPVPGADALAHSAQLQTLICAEISAAGGSIPFSRYMALALYAPGLGYYMAGARKLGADGDFVTAPELSPLFGQTLARQAAEVLAVAGCDAVLEIGAGSGALAAALLEELERLDQLPAQYLILELSPDLRARSRDTLAARVPHLVERVAWLNQLPPRFSGFIIGNEVLDAMPCALISTSGGEILETHVQATAAGGFDFVARAPQPAVLAAARALALPPEGYRTELQLEAQAFLRTLGGVLERGVALFLDYGFPQREYYHPQRSEGTLMCHYRHRAHADPFFYPGLQDLTTHVDFTAMAAAARAGGLALAGYASQAQFLINCGITDVLARTSAADVRAYAPLAAGVQKLLAPSEMGELFKAIAFSRQWDTPLAGFSSGDRSGAL
jgi:SAM-dependent MidA family methyltransferase